MDETIGSGAEGDTTAVSLFGDANATNDFPVLKAFQQYVDAEQAKARKRMIGLSAFFIALLFIVIIAFIFILTAFINRNQALSDRLLDIALNERAAAPSVVTVQPSAPQPAQPAQPREDTLKPVLQQLENLAAAIKTKNETPAPATAAVPAGPSAEELAARKQLEERLAKQDAEMKKMRETMSAAMSAAKKEEARQAEVERHRRRLYPEYYAKEDARKAEEAKPASVKLDDEIAKQKAELQKLRDAVAAEKREQERRELDRQKAELKKMRESIDAEKKALERQEAAERRAFEEKKAAKPKADAKAKDEVETALDGVKPVSYFADDDEDLADLVRQTKKAKKDKDAKAKTDAAKAKPAAKPAVKPAVKPAPTPSATLEVDVQDGDSIPMIMPNLEK